MDAVFVNSSFLSEVAQGKPEAMAECLNRYGGLVWAMAYRRCHNRADAEDVVQEIFLDIWRSADRFDPDQAAESTFIAMIARRRLIDYQRRQGSRAVESLQTEPVDHKSLNVDRLEVNDEVERARELFKQLRPDEQHILQLSVERGLSHTEIAQQTQMPLGTIKSHARRGLIRLRELLGLEVREHASGGRR